MTVGLIVLSLEPKQLGWMPLLRGLVHRKYLKLLLLPATESKLKLRTKAPAKNQTLKYRSHGFHLP